MIIPKRKSKVMLEILNRSGFELEKVPETYHLIMGRLSYKELAKPLIIEDFKSGLNKQQLVIKYGLSYMQIRTLLKTVVRTKQENGKLVSL